MPTPYRHFVWLDVAGVALLLVFLLGSLAYLATEMTGSVEGGAHALLQSVASSGHAGPDRSRWRHVGRQWPRGRPSRERNCGDSLLYSPNEPKRTTPRAIRIALARAMGNMYFHPSSMS